MEDTEKITKGHPATKSADLIAEQIEQLKQIFPEVIKEGKVDFEALQDLLGNYIDPSEERFCLNWSGKSNARREAQKRSTGTLRPCPEESVDWNTTQNLYIEGDNLEVLKLLQKSYHNAVKMIYIDPPYNTGKDFVYKDNYKDNLANYLEITGQNKSLSTNTELDGRFHSNWLNMMYPRLKLAHSLLKDDGVIFISIDDNEVANLRKVCDEIFGEENFVGSLIIQTATDNNPGQIKTEHEYLLCFANNKSKLEHWFSNNKNAELIQEKYERLKLEDLSIDDIQKQLRAWITKNKKLLKGVTHYNNVDERGVFHDADIANTVYGGYEYEVIHPTTGLPCKMPEKGYRFPEETFYKMKENGDIVFGDDENTLIKPKTRIENAKDVLRSVIYEDGRGSTKRFESLMKRDIFQNPKSDTIISRLINFTTKKDDIVLDFFSGSATTAEAVFNLNGLVDKNLKFILVQLPENLDKSLLVADSKSKKTILNAIKFLDEINKPHLVSEIGKERIRRAGKKIIEEQKPKAPDLFEGKKPKLDVGFKVFKLDSSNIYPWDVAPENLEETMFKAVQNIKPDRSEQDLLYEILIKYGIDLVQPIKEHIFAGQKVYVLGAGALIVCLGNHISTDTVQKIAQLKKELKPDVCRVVFKDTGFEDNPDKTNAIQILKQAGIVDIATV
ncbi:MAG: site-specific DNA-methyltransferase [Bacteroidales bacterium]|nr:site-specific DNA-methyltransferase [Bacteroidales bacterium]